MSLVVAFRHAARAEVLQAASWYEARRTDLGVEFISKIDRCIDLAIEQPMLFPVIHHGVRRVVAERFPYCLYYRAEPCRIVVIAVFHASRDPSTWRRRA